MSPEKSKREIFLQEDWLAYPICPADFHGTRVKSTHPDAVEFENGRRLLWSELHLVARTEFKNGKDLFSAGDWVAIRESEVVLLAPALSRAPGQTPNWQTQKSYSKFLQGIRQFFTSLGFLEAHTPNLVTCPGTEPYLDPFMVELWQGGQRLRRYLPTSPELHLKKMLCQGSGPVFEMKTCFRNNENSPWHEPEFLMLEWYRPFAPLDALIQDLQNLFTHLRLDIESIKRTSMAQLFEQHVNFKLTPTTTAGELLSLAKDCGLKPHGDESFDVLFNWIFVDRIEPKLDKALLVVENYPPSLAAYSRVGTSGWAERFEVYWQGVELANAFHEVNDPSEQRRRMQRDVLKKNEIGKTPVDLDEEFFAFLESGMPPTSGIAFGVERLFALAHDHERIQKSKLFPHTNES